MSLTGSIVVTDELDNIGSPFAQTGPSLVIWRAPGSPAGNIA
jgi:hypothetical protein